jgi:uncharacterized protein (DUF58 family)
VSDPPTGGGTPAWRVFSAVFIGMMAGVCGVVVTRAVFGPRAVVAGAVVGAVALCGGVVLSWAGLTGNQDRTAAPGAGRPRLRSHTHPVAWFAPVAGSAVAMVAWAGVAHSSGSGWVQAVGALLAAVLITGLLAPYVAARRATLTCSACPSDGQAGRPSTLTMTANGPLRIRPRYPVGTETGAVGPPYGPRTVDVPITPSRRGVIDRVVVEVASCAPFGLLWWAREVEVALPRPLHIAPRFGDPARMETTTTRSAGDSPRRAPSGVGEPRGVRPYRSGDTRRSVHWPATSHVGTLMVREKEHQTDDPIMVDVVLPPDPPAAETEAERVMAGVAQSLLQGETVLLGTRESGGHIVRVVRDRIDLGRRLARAVASLEPVLPPAVAPDAGSKADTSRKGRRA